MRSIRVFAAGLAVCLFGCVTELTPAMKAEKGLSAVNQAQTVEQVIEALVDYEVPEVEAAAQEKLAQYSVSDLMPYSVFYDRAKEEYFEKMRAADRLSGDPNQQYKRIERYKRNAPFLVALQKDHGEGWAKDRESAFERIAQKYCRELVTQKRKDLSAEQLQNIFCAWGLSDEEKLKLVDASNQKIVKELFKEAKEEDLVLCFGLYEMIKDPAEGEYLAMIKTIVPQYHKWKGNTAFCDDGKRMIAKGKTRFAFGYLWATQSSRYDDQDEQFAKAFFDEEMWAELYAEMRSEIRKDVFDGILGRNAAYRKEVASRVNRPELVEDMLLRVTGFNKDSDDIGIDDCLKRMNDDARISRIAIAAKDPDVRMMAMETVKNMSAVVDAVIKDEDPQWRMRYMRKLIAVLKSRTNQTNTERENLERLNGIVRVRVNAILEDGKQKSKDVFVLNGFYPGMSCDDAEILLGWYYPDAKVEQWVDNDDGDRYVTLDGRKICFANRKGEVSKLDFPAKVLFDWLGFKDSNLRCWIEKFRSKFDLPEFTFDVEQNSFNFMGIHKVETVSVYYYRHPKGWKIALYGEKDHSARGSVMGVGQPMSRTSAGGNLVISF